LSVSVAEGPDEEAELLRAMTERFKAEPKFALALGQNLLEQSKAADARKVLEPLTKHADAAVKCAALMGLAHVNLAQDEPKKALKHLQAAEHADATAFGSDGWTLFGQTYETLGHRTEALAAYKRALEQEEDATDILEALARLTIVTGKREDAVAYLRRLTVVAADDPGSLAIAAEGYARVGRFEDALDLANRTKGENGQMPPPARTAVGLALAHQGEAAKALELLTGPDPDATVLVARIRARLAIGDLSGAAADADAAKAVEEPTAELRSITKQVQTLVNRRDDLAKADSKVEPAAVEKFVCAEHFYAAGQSADRVTALLAAAESVGPAYGLRAVVAIDRGRLTKALPDAEKAIRLAPKDHRGYFARGRVVFERGNAPAAVADLRKAVELSRRTDAAALHALAAALAQAGHRDEAVAAEREAIKLRPDVAEYQELLAELVARN
jgi:tetratricopeptide (TPR) repeat protein